MRNIHGVGIICERRIAINNTFSRSQLQCHLSNPIVNLNHTGTTQVHKQFYQNRSSRLGGV